MVTQGAMDLEFFLSMGFLFLLLVSFLNLSNFFFFFFLLCDTRPNLIPKPSSSSTATTTYTITTTNIVIFTDRDLSQKLYRATPGLRLKVMAHPQLAPLHSYSSMKKFGLGSNFLEQHVLVIFFVLFLSNTIEH